MDPKPEKEEDWWEEHQCAEIFLPSIFLPYSSVRFQFRCLDALIMPWHVRMSEPRLHKRGVNAWKKGSRCVGRGPYVVQALACHRTALALRHVEARTTYAAAQPNARWPEGLTPKGASLEFKH